MDTMNKIATGAANKAVKKHEQSMHKKGFYKGGKTDADMLKMGRGLAKVQNQKTGMRKP